MRDIECLSGPARWLAAAGILSACLLGSSGCFWLAAATPVAASAAARPSPAPAPASTAAAAPAPAPVDLLLPEVDIAPPKGMPDLRTSIGGRRDGGGAPVALKDLKVGMTPKDVHALFPAARQYSQVDTFGSSSSKPRDLPGVETIEFSYVGGKLVSAALRYKTSLTSAAFVDYFRRVVINKYGPWNEDPMWYDTINGGKVLAQKYINCYSLQYTLPE